MDATAAAPHADLSLGSLGAAKCRECASILQILAGGGSQRSAEWARDLDSGAEI